MSGAAQDWRQNYGLCGGVEPTPPAVAGAGGGGGLYVQARMMMELALSQDFEIEFVTAEEDLSLIAVA